MKTGYFVYADYLPPGKHEIVVQFEMNQPAYLSFIVEPRLKELPIKRKRVKKPTQINLFSLKDSVF